MEKYNINYINNNPELQKEIRNKVAIFTREVGFSIWGIAKVKEKNSIPHLNEWVEMGNYADMNWFKESVEKRNEILKWFPPAKSVIVFAHYYFHQCNVHHIAKYAHGRDYHKIINRKIRTIAQSLSQLIEGFQYKISVDTAPVHEKTWATRAGLGWQGKNSLVINPHYGSWFLLGILVTNIKLPPDKEIENSCENCNLCIKACPTGAISEQGFVDCRKCLSYHTIENKKSIPLEIQNIIKTTIFGCDICQNVCPWNNNKVLSNNVELCLIGDYKTEDVFIIDEEKFYKIFKETPIKRAGFNRFKRIAEIYLKNRE